MVRSCVAAILAACCGTVGAQTAVPQNQFIPIKDTSVLKPPSGDKVAIVEFDDLECPACAKAAPLVDAAEHHFHVPLVQYDYPLTKVHVWSFAAAVTARYLRDAVSPQASAYFRWDVFHHQNLISSPDDLAKFTAKWFADHGLKLPKTIDPRGIYAKEVSADRDLALRMGLPGTPIIFVVTPNHWTEVLNWYQLDAVVGQAVAAANQP